VASKKAIEIAVGMVSWCSCRNIVCLQEHSRRALARTCARKLANAPYPTVAAVPAIQPRRVIRC
jgi:hypothetical protein